MKVWIFSCHLNLISPWVCVIYFPQRSLNHCRYIKANSDIYFARRNSNLHTERIFWVENKLIPTLATYGSTLNLCGLVDYQLRIGGACIGDMADKNFELSSRLILYNSRQVVPAVETEGWISWRVAFVQSEGITLAREHARAPKSVLIGGRYVSYYSLS